MSCAIITKSACRKDSPKRTWRRQYVGERRPQAKGRARERSRCPLPQQPSLKGLNPCRIDDPLLRLACHHTDGLSRKPRRRSHCWSLWQPSAVARLRRRQPRHSQVRWLIRRPPRRETWGQRIPPRNPSSTSVQQRIPRLDLRAMSQQHGHRQAVRRPIRARWRIPQPRLRVISPRPQLRSPP